MNDDPKIGSILVRGLISPNGVTKVELEPVFNSSRSLPNQQGALLKVIGYSEKKEIFRWSLSYAWTDEAREDIAPPSQDIPANSPVRFSGRIPFFANLHRIEIVNRENVLIRKELSGAPPKLTNIKIKKADSVWNLSWKLQKNKGSPTWVMIRHSPNNGKNWRRLVPRTNRKAVDIPIDAIHGNADSIIEIIAFDGIKFDRKTIGAAGKSGTAVRLVVESPNSDEELISPIALNAFAYVPGVLREDIEISWHVGDEIIATGNSGIWECHQTGKHTIHVQATSGSESVHHDVEIFVIEPVQNAEERSIPETE